MCVSRRSACLYGIALGDAVGVPFEFKPKAVAEAHPFPGVPGNWSDDTEQALCILSAYFDPKPTFEVALAREIKHWYDTNGEGCGHLTRQILTHPSFLSDPCAVARSFWEAGGKKKAPNGAVMRVGTVAMLHPGDLKLTEDYAVRSALVTHTDPRCVASAAAVAVAAACLISKGTINDAIEVAKKVASKYDSGASAFIDSGLDELDLDEGVMGLSKIGYTYKALGAGFWALRTLRDEEQEGNAYLSIIEQLVREGGDADTNAAVAGALLGSALGMEGMPKSYLRGWVMNVPVLEEYLKLFA